MSPQANLRSPSGGSPSSRSSGSSGRVAYHQFQAGALAIIAGLTVDTFLYQSPIYFGLLLSWLNLFFKYNEYQIHRGQWRNNNALYYLNNIVALILKYLAIRALGEALDYADQNFPELSSRIRYYELLRRFGPTAIT